MSTATTELAIPSLDDLYRMTALPDQRVVISDVSWAFYEQLVNAISSRAYIHVDYDGKDLEIMSPSPTHDDIKVLMAQLVHIIAQALRIRYKSLGQTTWKRQELARGLESDDCFFFEAEKLEAIARAKAQKLTDIADYPNPDLSLEVDISPPKIDRAGIYAALRVAELWRFDGGSQEVIIERLGDDGSYHPVDESGFLPVRAEDVRRWVVDENSDDLAAWAERLRAWAQLEVAPRTVRQPS